MLFRSVLYFLEHTEHSKDFWNKVEAILVKQNKCFEAPFLSDISQVASLFERFLAASGVQQEAMKGSQRRSFICIALLRYAPKFFQKNEGIALPYGLISEISRVLETARSWVHEMVQEVKTRYQVYYEFKAEIISLVQKMYR